MTKIPLMNTLLNGLKQIQKPFHSHLNKITRSRDPHSSRSSGKWGQKGPKRNMRVCMGNET